jgi:energy-coupling factor transport system ATP-binding protein
LDFALEASIDEFRYPRGTRPAIRGIDVKLRRHDFVAVVGPAGAGKTTLCYCLAGAIPHFVRGAYLGCVTVGGQDLARLRLPEIAPLVGFVQQRPENQLFNLTVEEDVAFGPENLCLDSREIQDQMDESLAFVGMQGFARRAPDTLSGGEAQRAVLGSILAMGPDLLVLDQPAAELDPLGRAQVYANLCRLNQESGKTIVLVEDRLEDVLPFLTRVLLMLDGQVVKDAPPDAFFAHAALSSYGIRVPDSESLRHPQLRRPSEGDRGPNAARSEASLRGTSNHASVSEEDVHEPSGTYVVETRDLGFRYPTVDSWALNGVSLGFRRGEFAAIIGGNGAGKTTLAKQLAGLLKPSKGRVLVDGRDISRASAANVSSTVGYLFQDPDYQLFCNSVFDEAGFSLRIKKMPPRLIAELVDATLQRLGLFSVREHHPYTLSRSQRQRLALASILVRDPTVLVVDEPSTGLDYRGTIEMMELLAEFPGKGRAVIMITHDMEMILRYTQRSVVMSGGRVELDTATKELFWHSETLARASIRLPASYRQSPVRSHIPGEDAKGAHLPMASAVTE